MISYNLMVLCLGENSMATISKEYRGLFQVRFFWLEGPLLDSFAFFLMIDSILIYYLLSWENILDALFIQYEKEDISSEVSNNDYSGISDTDAMVNIAKQM